MNHSINFQGANGTLPSQPMSSLSRAIDQIFPPKPRFTKTDVGDLRGRVYIVTGATSGAGKELARILYSKNAKIYITGRSEDKGTKTIQSIKTNAPESSGSLVFLQLDLEDMLSIKRAAGKFAASEPNLHVLFNTASTRQTQNTIERTNDGVEKHIQINCLGPFLLFKLLAPILVATAQDPATPPDTVRVIWLSSFAAEQYSDKHTGLQISNLDYHTDPRDPDYRYGVSKLGNWFYAVETSRHYDGAIIGLGVDTGKLRTEDYQSQSTIRRLVKHPVTYPAINGAYTLLWAGLSPKITRGKSGSYVAPFGRFFPVREDLKAAARLEAEGGNGATRKFWDWSEEQVKSVFLSKEV